MQKSIKMQVVVAAKLLLLLWPRWDEVIAIEPLFTQDKVAKVLAIKEKRIFISLGI